MKKKQICLIITAIIACFILSSCEKKIETEEDGDDLIVEPESKNSIHLAIESVDTLNPIFTKSISVADCMSLVFDPLFTFDESFNPIPELAESCIPSDDMYSYTVRIKDGIFWHDGKELTAYDVLHSINLIRYNESIYTNSLRYIRSVNVTDDRTIVIKLQRPLANFAALLSFPIVEDSVSTEPGNNYIPIGTGPFKYSEKSSSDKIKLVVNENVQGTKPSVNEIYLKILKDADAVVNAFNASEIDAVTSTLMDLRENTPRGEIIQNDYISNNMSFLGFNNLDGFLSSANTRKALSYMINKDEIVTTEIFSRAVSAKTPINPQAWYCPKITDTTYDEEYIKEVLFLDGWQQNSEGDYERTREEYREGEETPVNVTETLKTDIIVNEDNDERYRVAKKIADKFNESGVETTITLLSFEDYQQRIQDKNYQMFIGEVKLPHNMDNYSLLCDSNNYFAYSSQAMQDAIFKIGVSKTSEEEILAYENFSKLFAEEMPYVPLFFRKESVIYESCIAGYSFPTIFRAYQDPENWYITKNITSANETIADKEK